MGDYHQYDDSLHYPTEYGPKNTIHCDILLSYNAVRTFLITLSALLAYPIFELIEVIRYATSTQYDFSPGTGLKRLMRGVSVEYRKHSATAALTLAGLALFEYYRAV